MRRVSEEDIALRQQGKKRCHHCNQILPRTVYAKQAARWDGLYPWCRQCMTEKWYEENPGNVKYLHQREEAKRLLAQGKKQCNRCGKVKLLSEFRKWKSKLRGECYGGSCRDCRREKERELYDKRHPERENKRKQQRQDKQNAEIYSSYGLKYCPKCGKWKHTEEFNRRRGLDRELDCYCRECNHVFHKEYRKTSKSKERKRKTQAARQARKKGLRCDLTLEQWQAICEAFGFRCAYCGDETGKLYQEHVIPLNQGGEYTVTNIVPACPSCNVKKRDADWKEWMLETGLDWQSFQDKWNTVRMETI